MARVDSPVPLMHHDPDRSWITDPDPDHPKGTQPILFCDSEIRANIRTAFKIFGQSCLPCRCYMLTPPPPLKTKRKIAAARKDLGTSLLSWTCR